MWEKEKMLITSIFSFSHSILPFYTQFQPLLNFHLQMHSICKTSFGKDLLQDMIILLLNDMFQLLCMELIVTSEYTILYTCISYNKHRNLLY